MNIKIKRLTDTAKIPTKAHSTDACFDIYVDEPVMEHIAIAPGSAVTLHTGFATDIPEGYWCPVFARSGLGIKKNLRPSNCVGVIDSSYRGEWMVALYNDSKDVRVIEHGDRIAQFAVLPVIEAELEEVGELDETERGTGGFGSTGK